MGIDFKPNFGIKYNCNLTQHALRWLFEFELLNRSVYSTLLLRMLALAELKWDVTNQRKSNPRPPNPAGPPKANTSLQDSCATAKFPTSASDRFESANSNTSSSHEDGGGDGGIPADDLEFFTPGVAVRMFKFNSFVYTNLGNHYQPQNFQIFNFK